MNTVQSKANPKAAFWFCNFAFTLERFSYYSAKWLIIQFIALEAAKGGLGITDGSNAVYQSFFVAFTYLAPLFGSVLSCRNPLRNKRHIPMLQTSFASLIC